MGFSDSTITHFMRYQAGVMSFYGPSIMAGFGENTGIFPYMKESVLQTCFSNQVIGTLPELTTGRTSERLPRDNPANQNIARKLEPCT